jgi:hypothetical protein
MYKTPLASLTFFAQQGRNQFLDSHSKILETLHMKYDNDEKGIQLFFSD